MAEKGEIKMIKTYDAKERLKKYYQSASGKQYDFGSDLDTNVGQSGVTGSKLEELKAKTRAYLNAYDAYNLADSNYDAALKSIETRQQNIAGLRDAQLAENDKTAMRQASVAGANYELLKRYLPEYNAQSGTGNLGVGSGAHTDAYAAYMSALSESASSAADRKSNVMQNYLSDSNNLDEEKMNAAREKLSAYGVANKELSSALASADDAATVKVTEQNTAVMDKALSLMATGANEDGTYTKDSVDKAFKYVKEFATDETAAADIIKQLKAETIDNYDMTAKYAYDDDPNNDNMWGRLDEGVDIERNSKYNLNFGDESIEIKTSGNAIEYDKMTDEAKNLIKTLQNGDVVSVSDHAGTYYFVVDDMLRDDVKPRFVSLLLNGSENQKKLEKYAIKLGNKKLYRQ